MKSSKNIITGIGRLFFPFCLLLLLSSCSDLDETTITEEEDEKSVVLTDAWICDMKSFEEDLWRYEIFIDDNGDYTAVSNTRILKVSKDGILNSMILLTYPDTDNFVVRIFNGKIYRFHTSNEFQNYDPTEPLNLQVYDFDFNLLSSHVLNSNGIVYDVEIENDDEFGMLVYEVDNSTMTLKKFNLIDGSVLENVLSTTGTSPTNLHIAESGNYFCTASSTRKNFHFLDNDLNLIWENEFEEYTISDAKYVSGKGIYITGRVSSFVDPTRPSFVALIDTDGNKVNSFEYDGGERWSPYMEINDDRICLVQTEPETGLNMLLSILEYDLTLESTIDIQGNIVQSDIIVNELGSFSFVYGIATDPTDPNTFPEVNTRIFKFGTSYGLPVNVIVQ